jgi:hypothetical protein
MDAAGKQRLEGHTGTLRIKGNGGVEPLVLDNPPLIPDDYCVWQGQISAAQFRQFSLELMTDPITKLERRPSNALIREGLAEDCPRCDGNGVFEGSGFNGQWDYGMMPEDPCNACGGSGKRGVPGAHLEPRGRHVEVK